MASGTRQRSCNRRAAPAHYLARTSEFIALITGLPIVIDDQTPNRALSAVLDLARSQRLSAYDAGYLELAMRRGIPLATKDDALAKAARRVGVSLLATF